jgi:pyochelin biosynthetic protein PchC
MTWLQCPRPRPYARQRLVCFPHAGGSASFFRDWGSALPSVEVHTVCYPGRAARIGDPRPTDLVAMAEDIAAAVEPLTGDDLPVVLFGHSMGAVVAFETARLLQTRGAGPSHLYASGSRGPRLSRVRPGASTHESDKYDDLDVVTAQLSALGGTDAELLADPAFRDLVLPYVLGDFRMFDAYEYRPDPPLTCGVTAIVGDADPQVSPVQSAAWREVTDGPFRHVTVPGDHFYLAHEPPFALLTGTGVPT